MLVVVDKQLEHLGRVQKSRFVQEMAGHLRRFYPEETSSVSPEDLAGRIELGISAAARHGFHSRSDVARYLNLAFEFGDNFENDPACSWARPVLEQSRPCAAALYAAALDALGGETTRG